MTGQFMPGESQLMLIMTNNDSDLPVLVGDDWKFAL